LDDRDDDIRYVFSKHIINSTNPIAPVNIDPKTLVDNIANSFNHTNNEWFINQMNERMLM